MNKNIKFCNYNYAEDADDITVSSETSPYLKANMSNTIRSKVWKPGGYFYITAANNKFYYADGSPKTSTITEGEYTAASLVIEIQAQLDADSGNWTVSYSSTTFKFNISRIFTSQLTFTSTTNAIWDTLGYTYTFDYIAKVWPASEQRAHSFEYIQIDNGTPLDVRCVCAVCPIDEIFNLTSAATVTLQGNDLDDFDSPPFEQVLTFDDRGIFYFFDDDVDTEYRYHRLVIKDQLNPDGPTSLKIGYLYIGDTEDIESSNVAQGFSKAQLDPSTTMESESGQKYFDLRLKREEIGALQIQNITDTDRLKIEQIFNDYGIHTPLFVTLDPLNAAENSISTYTKYCYFKSNPVYTHQFLSYYTVQFALEEAV